MTPLAPSVAFAVRPLVELVLTTWLIRSDVTGWMDGARLGASLGFAIWLGVNLLFYGWDGGQLRLHLTDAVLEGVRWGGAGAVIVLVIRGRPADALDGHDPS